METIELINFKEVINRIAACGNRTKLFNAYGNLYATTGDNLLTCNYYFSSTEDMEEKQESILNEQGLWYLLEVQTFADVLSVQKGEKPNSSLEEYAKAVAYYVDKDAFLIPNNEYDKSVENEEDDIQTIGDDDIFFIV
ncbi:hypothetical protein ACI6Q2_09510 [Chitinophagaceae bacterium LWZ2-11]